MRKNILCLALVLASMIGTSAMAQSPSASQQQPSQTAVKPASKARINPFDGLNLTEKQQADLKALQDGYKAERQKIAKAKKAERKQMKEQRNQERKQMIEQMKEQRKQESKEYLAKIKAILTPEQYVLFLENTYINKVACPFGGHNNGKHGMRPGKHKKDGRQAVNRKHHGGRDQRAAATPAQNTTK